MNCPVCHHECETNAGACPDCGSALGRESDGESSRPQEFARRLLGLDAAVESDEGQRLTPAPNRSIERPAPVMTPPRTRPYLDFRPPVETVLEEPLERLTRQLGFAFATYLATLALSGGLGFASALSLLVLVLTGGGWQAVAGTAVLGSLGFAGLAYLLYRPPESQRSGIAKLARFRAASASLDKLLRFWDATVSSRADEDLDVGAVSAAVHSLALGCKNILDLIEHEAPAAAPTASAASDPGFSPAPAQSTPAASSASNGRSRY